MQALGKMCTTLVLLSDALLFGFYLFGLAFSKALCMKKAPVFVKTWLHHDADPTFRPK